MRFAVSHFSFPVRVSLFYRHPRLPPKGLAYYINSFFFAWLLLIKSVFPVFPASLVHLGYAVGVFGIIG